MHRDTKHLLYLCNRLDRLPLAPKMFLLITLHGQATLHFFMSWKSHSSLSNVWHHTFISFMTDWSIARVFIRVSLDLSLFLTNMMYCMYISVWGPHLSGLSECMRHTHLLLVLSCSGRITPLVKWKYWYHKVKMLHYKSKSYIKSTFKYYQQNVLKVAKVKVLGPCDW